MTATRNSGGQSYDTPGLPDTAADAEAADSGRAGSGQWRYASAVEAAQALNAAARPH